MVGKVVLSTLDHVWAALEPLHVRMAIMGGVALSVWRHLRSTHDIDLLVDPGSVSIDQILDQLYRAGLRPKKSPPIVSVGSLRIVQLLYEPPEITVDVQVDLLLAESEYQRKALDRRVETAIPGCKYKLAVLSCEDLILHKLLAFRMIDRADIATLFRENLDSLDVGYVISAAKLLGISQELLTAWEDAFPGESLPTE